PARLAAVALLLAVCGPAVLAHPGSGIVVDRQGNVYCIHQAANAILKITPDGKVSTWAQGVVGEGDKRQVRFANPHHLCTDGKGNLFTCGDGGSTGVWRIDAAGKLTRHYPPEDWFQQILVGSGGDPFAVDGDGVVYCPNERQFKYCQVLAVSPEGRIRPFAGGDWGLADGDREAARLQNLHYGAMT